MQKSELVFSVRVGDSVFCLPPDEPITGVTRAVPPRELLRRVVNCTPNMDLVADQPTRDAFCGLLGNTMLEVMLIGDADRIGKMLDSRNSSGLEAVDGGLRAQINFPAFIHLARSGAASKIELAAATGTKRAESFRANTVAA